MRLFDLEGGFTAMVASTRVRLARNITGYRYGRQSAQALNEMKNKVWDAILAAPALAPHFTVEEVLPGTLRAQHLVEQHLVSPDLAARGGFAVLSKDHGVSIMIGEEDHLRIQVIGKGLCPRECLTEALRLAQLLEASIPMDSDEKLGYLTACPTNLGTGLRVSVMLHLPMLTATGGIQNVIGWAGQQGCAVRGAFGEGSQAEGYFYQLSNQVTLGLSEQMLADRVTESATRIIEAEQRARQLVREHDDTGLTDRLCRAAGTLQSARKITTKEANTCLSDVLMALQLGIMEGVKPTEIYAALQNIRPASIIQAGGQEKMTEAQRDISRADRLRADIGQKLHIII